MPSVYIFVCVRCRLNFQILFLQLALNIWRLLDCKTFRFYIMFFDEKKTTHSKQGLHAKIWLNVLQIIRDNCFLLNELLRQWRPAKNVTDARDMKLYQILVFAVYKRTSFIILGRHSFASLALSCHLCNRHTVYWKNIEVSIDRSKNDI